jgi:hypothetical protein
MHKRQGPRGVGPNRGRNSASSGCMSRRGPGKSAATGIGAAGAASSSRGATVMASPRQADRAARVQPTWVLNPPPYFCQPGVSRPHHAHCRLRRVATRNTSPSGGPAHRRRPAGPIWRWRRDGSRAHRQEQGRSRSGRENGPTCRLWPSPPPSARQCASVAALPSTIEAGSLGEPASHASADCNACTCSSASRPEPTPLLVGTFALAARRAGIAARRVAPVSRPSTE